LSVGNKPDLRVNLAGVALHNPVMVASGTFGTGEEYAPFMDVNRLGAIITKTVTLEKRKGNPPPRIWETPSGLLNSIGLQNKGIDRFLKEDLPLFRRLHPAIIANIAGFEIDEYVTLARKLNAALGISALELNISCPNVKEGGVIFGSNPKIAAEVVKETKKVSRIPLIVKLSPNVNDIVTIAQAVEEAGADAISLVNTFIGMAIDPVTFKPRISNIVGGLSGPAIRPIAVRMVWEVAQKVKVPVVGIGGITSVSDALEFFLAGATAVAVGTANLVNPGTPAEIIDDLEKFLVKKGLNSINDVIGGVEA